MRRIHDRHPRTINTVLAGALSVAALTACTGGGEAAQGKSTSIAASAKANVTPKPEVTVSRNPQEIAAARLTEYAQGPERNKKISAFVQQAGVRVIKLGDKSKIGYFDFYNDEKDNWKSKVPAAANAGWGHLQHNPQYGGSNTQVAITAYRNTKGGYDLNKGVKSFMIDVPGTSLAVGFEARPDPTISPEDHAPETWTVSIIDLEKLRGNNPNYMEKVNGYGAGGGLVTVEDAQATDARAIYLAEDAMNLLGFPR